MASATDNLGEPARVGQDGWELIGPPECPLLFRRTIASGRLGKLLLHRFVPDSSDLDHHDHPASFVTFVLRGGYDDIQPDGTVDRLRAPAVRRRRAEHAHITRVHEDGATTLVVMGPKRRAWGFWRGRRWWQWQDYERRFGLNFRCPDDGYDDRTAELDVAGAELGWDGATTREERR